MRIKRRLLAAVCSGAMLLSGTALPTAAEGEASDAPLFYVSNVTAEQGETVSVTVSVKNDPGIVAFRLFADYNTDVLKFISAEGASISKEGCDPVDVTYGFDEDSTMVISWGDGLHGNYTYDGGLITFKVEVSEDAETGVYPVILSYDVEDVFDKDYNNVDFEILSGTVTVKCKHSYSTSEVKPTCTEGGYTLHTCTKCGYSYTDNETGPLGHDYHSSVVLPTVEEGGYTVHSCSRCDSFYIDGYTDPIVLTEALSGRVTLVTGSAESEGIKVTAVDAEGTSFEAEVGGDGSYAFKDLADGVYSVTAVKDRFVPVTETVTVSGNTLLDLRLYLYGDCDGDGSVNMLDLTLMQRSINGWDVTVIKGTGDLNGDGSVNMLDLTLLQRFINGWDVPLGKAE